jgi:aryl-alcohol dehydrogenase-like predicted oxidoreductase
MRFARKKNEMNRRDLIKRGLSLGASAALPGSLLAQRGQILTRKIPSTGEEIPVIGIGTARRYSPPAGSPERAELKEVIRLFVEGGGKVIDTAPSYERAEPVVGELVADLTNRSSLFLATKVGANGKDAGLREIEQSFKNLRTDKIDLIAVHNLRDTATQLATLRALKGQGRIRYIGVTTSFAGQHQAFEETLRREQVDVAQVDYALDNRAAADRILPTAMDRGAAVMVNLPFGRSRLFEATSNVKLPEWAGEFDCQSWAQFFLKYIVSHTAVTCAIPGTARVRYVADNLGGAKGRLPDAAMRKRMEQFIDNL